MDIFLIGLFTGISAGVTGTLGAVVLFLLWWDKQEATSLDFPTPAL